MTKNISKYVLKKEWLYFLVYIVLSSITFLFWSCIFFDERKVYADYGGKEKMSSYDARVMRQLGLSGITKQSYILPMFFFLIILLFFFFLWTYISYKNYARTIILMRVRGLNKWESQYRFLGVRVVYFVLSNTLSVATYLFELWILFCIMQTKHMIVSFSPYIFVVIIIYLLAYLFVNLPFYTRPYHSKNLIHFLRENY